MKDENQEVSQILHNTKERLDRINLFVENLHSSSDPQEKQVSFFNVISWGRTITFLLQNLKTPVGKERFDEWYTPFQEEMRADELLKYFKDARNHFEKRGKVGLVGSAVIKHLNTDEVNRELSINPPKNVIMNFVGDELGGSGWLVKLQDGSVGKVYAKVNFPGVHLQSNFCSPTTKHKGKEIGDSSIQNCSELYYSFLNAIFDSACGTFLKS